MKMNVSIINLISLNQETTTSNLDIDQKNTSISKIKPTKSKK